MTKSEIDRLYAEVETVTQNMTEKDFLRASSTELGMYFHCKRNGQEMPEAGSEEFWELFDLVNSSGRYQCRRELMEEYLQRPEQDFPSPYADDPAVRELDRLIEERKRHKHDGNNKISADL